jgi:hypothetical protein
MTQPENRPLPELPPAILKKIELARARAQAKLLDELNDCWAVYFHSTKAMRPQMPQGFFGPFVTYGVSLYDTFGGALLELQPSPADYLDWMEFGLKSRICEEIAPHWSTEQLKESARLLPRCPLPNSGWENWMAYSWRVLDHPEHDALEPEARSLISSLRNPLDFHWNAFLTLLLNGMSCKTPHWRAGCVEQLPSTVKPPSVSGEIEPGKEEGPRKRTRGKPKPSACPKIGTVNKKQAAEILGVSTRTIERMDLPKTQTKQGSRYKAEDVRRLLDERGVRQAPTK